MKPTTEELLNDDHYTKLAELAYTEMIPFVQQELRCRNGVVRGYFGLNALILLAMIGMGIWQIRTGQIGIGRLIGNTFLGFALVLTVLVPVHEAIHGLAYKLVGAKKVSFGGDWRKFYFYAVADHFVANRRAFYLVALAPFIMISAIVIASLFFAPVQWQWILWGILLMHTGACSGDFAMLGFYKRHSQGELYTFDDVENKVAYFFQRK